MTIDGDVYRGRGTTDAASSCRTPSGSRASSRPRRRGSGAFRACCSGCGLKTVVPPFAEVKISCRMVPAMTGQRVFELVRDFVKSKNPDVEITAEHGLEPYRGASGAGACGDKGR